jgi:predicted ATPase
MLVEIRRCPMIERIEFENFRILKKATLELSPLTLLIGPNGSGKSTVLRALSALRQPASENLASLTPIGLSPQDAPPSVSVCMRFGKEEVIWREQWKPQARPAPQSADERVKRVVSRIRVYNLDHAAISAPSMVQAGLELSETGGNLTAVLDQIRDAAPERFEAINSELCRWLPEYDRVLFATPGHGQKSFSLRLRSVRGVVPARALSQGTLLAMAMLTLAYLPDPPSVVCIEEPDRGLHPRLLRDVCDVLRRLAYPKDAGDDREPVQVIATSHSPSMLDLFRDRPEEVVIAERNNDNVAFHRLSDRTDLSEILHDTNLGDLWYAGVLGGVPVAP